MNIRSAKYRSFTILAGVSLLAILLFLLIPLSYSFVLPFVYWVNQFIFFSLLIGLIYLNTKHLAPKLLFRKKYFQYYSVLFICCILIILILDQTEVLLNLPEAFQKTISATGPKERHVKGVHSVAFYIFLVEILVLGVNIAAIIVQKWEEEENLRLIMEKEKIDLELSFLKTQINPHFFFNSLNTVNALTYSDIAQSRVALKKLGNIMRYVLYNTSTTKSSLGKEIEFIRNYIELMKLRSSPRVSIDFSIKVHSENIEIAPMLFLSLIENCFKHGISTQQDSPIYIGIETTDDTLIFCTRNKIFAHKMEESDEKKENGIGLKNAKRRLELIYPGKYSLSIERGQEYIVTLKIDLK